MTDGRGLRCAVKLIAILNLAYFGIEFTVAHTIGSVLRVVEDILKCKWTTSVLDKLDGGILQPGNLQRSIRGLSKKVMCQRLKKLEKFDLIVRRPISEKPLKVHYCLTPMGRRIHRIIREIKALV